MNLWWLAIAVLTLLFAHVLRTVRWRILLSHSGVDVSNLRPLSALSIGYLVNTLLPLRIGELMRAGLLAYTVRARFSTVLATVFVERLIDLAVVVLLVAVMFGAGHGRGLVMASFGGLTVLVAILYLVSRTEWGRRLLWRVSAIFNDRVKAAILHFCHASAQMLFSRWLLRSTRFWLLTTCMWCVYLTSLWLFSRASGDAWLDAFLTVYVRAVEGPLMPVLGYHDLWLAVYLTLPIPLILVYAYLSGFNALAGIKSILRSATRVAVYSGANQRTRNQAFRSLDQYHAYLDRHYGGHGGMLSEFETRGIDNVLLYRVFHGGSGAITALVEVEGTLRVRKFATRGLAPKLSVQRDWLEDNGALLPLVQVIETHSEADDYFYDMAYIGGSRDLYEGIHSEPIHVSTGLLADVIDRMVEFHKKTYQADAVNAVVVDYVRTKVLENFRQIRQEFDDIFELGEIELNGELFDLSRLDVMFDVDWFVTQFTDRRQASIHGDLTIENIMLNGTARDGHWFLIDPNPVNGFQSPLIDFAKLLQSLHLGYEALHKSPRATLSGKRLTVGLHRSFQYECIYTSVVNCLTSRFGADVMRQIFLHEWINYLRLIPYQLRANRDAGLAFFGCLCILVREYDRLYPEAERG